MSKSEANDKYSIPALVCRLCHSILKKNNDNFENQFQFALQFLNTWIMESELDEFAVAEQIKIHLIQGKREKDYLLFGELLRKAQESSFIQHRSAILHFLLEVAKNKQSTSNKNGHGRFIASTPFYPREIFDLPKLYEGAPPASINLLTKNNLSYDLTEVMSRSQKVHSLFSKRQLSGEFKILEELSSANKPLSPQIKSSSPQLKFQQSSHLSRCQVNESEIVQDLIYVFQAINGKIFKLDLSPSANSSESKLNLHPSIKTYSLHLAELGWLYNKVYKFCELRTLDKSLGLVVQSFVAAIKDELNEYHRHLAILDSQLSTSGCTLIRLGIWTLEPMERIRTLAWLVDACKDVKGGALASIVYSFLFHGDPQVQNIIKRILSVVVMPIYKMLTYWIYCGELDDMYEEFFIASRPSVSENNLWQEKYILRKSMVPSFLTMEQATKILSIGKSINYLRQVCQDHSCVQISKANAYYNDKATVDSLISQDKCGQFQVQLEKTYKVTSKQVLSVLHTKFKFTENLQAIRNYLLLGQGDFIKHLIDLIEEDLNRPANYLFLHNLSGTLESAIRSTNAQFADPDILKRLDVRLFETTKGDSGWDVFTLDYHVDGPIGTVITEACKMSYLRIFNALWKAKRMEHIATNLWLCQIKFARKCKRIPECMPLVHLGHTILSAMVHFMRQMQYYLAFEVIECSWAELLQKVNAAEDLDQVISAHGKFLDNVLTRALVDSSSKHLSDQLRDIYEQILRFKRLQEKFWNLAHQELDAMKAWQTKLSAHLNKGKWSIKDEEEENEKLRHQNAIDAIVGCIKNELFVLNCCYEEMVQKFLIMLTENDDSNLHLLSARLDFNEHYKSKNTLLQTSLTYQHQRRSFRP